MQAQPLGTAVPREHPSLSCPSPCSCLEDSFPAGSCGAQFVPPDVPIPSVTWGAQAGPGGVTARWGQSYVGRASLHAARSRATAAPVLPRPQPWDWFPVLLSQAGSDHGSAKVCQGGGPAGGLSSNTCMRCQDLTWAGGDTPEPLAAASMAPPWASDRGICTPFPKPPLCLCSWQQGPPTLLVFLALLVHVARAAGSPPAPAPPRPPPFAPGVPVSLGCGAAMQWGHEGTAGCRGLVCGCHVRALHAGTNS